MTVATSRSEGLSTMPSSITRQPSLTTGKKMNWMISSGLSLGGCPLNSPAFFLDSSTIGAKSLSADAFRLDLHRLASIHLWFEHLCNVLSES